MNGDALVDEQFDSFDKIPDNSISFNDAFALGICWERVKNSAGPLLSIFRGEITEFNFWARSISGEDLEKMTTDCSYTVNDENLHPLIKWDELNILELGEKAKNVSIRHNQVCGVKDNRTTSLILPIKLNYKTCKKSCENLGGKLPLYYNAGDLEDMIDKISSERSKKKLMGDCGDEIWMPIIQGDKMEGKDEYFWKEDVGNDSSIASFLPWELSQPNGQDLQQ